MLSLSKNVSLLGLNTLGIDCKVKNLAVVCGVDDLEYLVAHGFLGDGMFKTIGQGSNLVFCSDYNGTVLLMRNKGVRLVSETADHCLVEAAAGEVWDSFVKQCIRSGWHGLENLAAIPGTVGAAAVQNIGAYGVEVKDRIETVSVFDTATRRQISFETDQCAYGYRDSRFKHANAHRYIVTSVLFRLSKSYSTVLTYKALGDALDGAGKLDAATVAATVETIRWSKLPKPEELGNVGSFFKNPVVGEAKYLELKRRYPDMPAHESDEGWKLAAGWLIERSGWKGRSIGRCGVYERNALVLVNRGGCTGNEVKALAEAIAGDIEEKFGVKLECEAEFVQ